MEDILCNIARSCWEDMDEQTTWSPHQSEHMLIKAIWEIPETQKVQKSCKFAQIVMLIILRFVIALDPQDWR